MTLFEEIESDIDFLFDFADSEEWKKLQSRRGTKIDLKLKKLSIILKSAHQTVSDVASVLTINGESKDFE
jgi:hypothetical protein